MELTRDVTAQQLPFSQARKVLVDIRAEVRDAMEPPMTLSDQELFDKVEGILQTKIDTGNKGMLFQLGLLYSEQGFYDKAFKCFELSKDDDFQSLYQYSVMLYDGIGVEHDPTRAVDCMRKLVEHTSRYAEHLVPAASFNLGRAYFQGYGTHLPRPSDQEALRWWLIAADDGNPRASVKAQSVLGMFYCRQSYTLDLHKAFFWHSEACGNGSLESQGALGVMYLHGLGVRKDKAAAYLCLKNASDRGNVYATANLVALFYHHKLFSRVVDLAVRASEMTDIQAIARQTDCLPSYTQKGVAMAAFYLARCLHRGLGLQRDVLRAQQLYTKVRQLCGCSEEEE
ncbi:hypothetical protein ACOMHN_006235 [Nucella lapillus]